MEKTKDKLLSFLSMLNIFTVANAIFFIGMNLGIYSNPVILEKLAGIGKFNVIYALFAAQTVFFLFTSLFVIACVIKLNLPVMSSLTTAEERLDYKKEIMFKGIIAYAVFLFCLFTSILSLLINFSDVFDNGIVFITTFFIAAASGVVTLFTVESLKVKYWT